MEVAAGEVVGFLGPNGAGKTTTLRTLLGFLRPTSGYCHVLGGSPAQDPALKGRIGYLPGDFRADPAMTAADLFSWFGDLRGMRDRTRVTQLTARLDLDASRPFGQLSKGNRQKVGLVQAFMHDPEVLVLDEPTTGLDPLIQREFLHMTAEAAAAGTAVLFSSHVLPEVERIAHRVAIIRSGRLIALSTVEELLNHARHRVELHFAGEIPALRLREADGVADVEVDGRTAIVTIDGPIGPALHAATEHGQLQRIGSAGDELEDLFISLFPHQDPR